MFRLLSNAPLRRLLHTSARQIPSASRTKLGLAALGGSAVTTYVAWKTMSGPGLALDSVASSSSKSTHTKPKESKAVLTSDSDPMPTPLPDAAAEGQADSSASPDDASEAMGALAAEADAEAQEAGGGGAFNPVTGEINWDCPCLGGMAYGPCGMEFREAFSCFVFSEQEPKGIDCVEKFKAMQDCFRAHPEVYADEIMDDDEDDVPAAGSAEPMPVSDSPLDPTSSEVPVTSPATREPSAPSHKTA